MSVPFGTANSMPHPELEGLAGELAKHSNHPPAEPGALKFMSRSKRQESR